MQDHTRSHVASHADDLIGAAYTAHAGQVRRQLDRMLRDRAEAEDVLHEAFVRLLIEVRADRTPHNVQAWLRRAATNLAVSRIRHRAMARRRLEAAGREQRWISTPTDWVEEDDLDDALAPLPVTTRAALRLAADGFGGREIAVLIGRSELATRSMLCRARQRVRARLGELAFSRESAA